MIFEATRHIITETGWRHKLIAWMSCKKNPCTDLTQNETSFIVLWPFLLQLTWGHPSLLWWCWSNAEFPPAVASDAVQIDTRFVRTYSRERHVKNRKMTHFSDFRLGRWCHVISHSWLALTHFILHSQLWHEFIQAALQSQQTSMRQATSAGAL